MASTPPGLPVELRNLQPPAGGSPAFSNVKSEAEQALRRASIRVMGRTKMTLWALFSQRPPICAWVGSGPTANSWVSRKPAFITAP